MGTVIIIITVIIFSIGVMTVIVGFSLIIHAILTEAP